ncbi:MAG: TIGR03435 family protein [Edaphobacter sp.]
MSTTTVAGAARAQGQPGQVSSQVDQHEPPLAFSVVSVKENKTQASFGRAIFSEEGVSVENMPLLNVIRMAYNMINSVETQFIDVPGWAKTGRFDIEAKVDAGDLDRLHKLTRAERQVMLQKVLADRFGLRVHADQREQPVYLLVVAKKGAKISKVADIDPALIKGPAEGASLPHLTDREIDAKAIWMSSLAMMLTQVVHRPVMDRTGLVGNYDVELKWTPDLAGDAGSAGAGSDTGPSLFTAVQEQLGLKLQPAKQKVDVLVIDHLEMPSAN